MPSTSFGPDGFGIGDVRASASNSSGLGTFRCMRSKQFSHAGSTSFTRSVHVGNDFGLSRAGGIIYFMMHGWVNEYYLGAMRWHNAGGGGGIILSQKNIHNVKIRMRIMNTVKLILLFI